jgi:hypothetical protein
MVAGIYEPVPVMTDLNINEQNLILEAVTKIAIKLRRAQSGDMSAAMGKTRYRGLITFHES